MIVELDGWRRVTMETKRIDVERVTFGSKRSFEEVLGSLDEESGGQISMSLADSWRRHRRLKSMPRSFGELWAVLI
jgi:hypothetical protein